MTNTAGFWSLDDIKAAKSLARRIVRAAGTGDLPKKLTSREIEEIVSEARTIIQRVTTNRPADRFVLPL